MATIRQSANRGRNAIDDLASGDKMIPKSKTLSKKLGNSSTFSQGTKDITLSSRTSDAEFYKNLKKISGVESFDPDDDGEDSEQEELSDNAAKRLADDIGDLDDLDNDLFAGLAKTNLSPAPKKTKDFNAKPMKKLTKKVQSKKLYDPDDPLPDLGLSDDDENLAGKKMPSTVAAATTTNTSKINLPRRISSERMKVQPNGDENEHNKHEMDSTNDPFLSTDAKEGKITTQWRQRHSIDNNNIASDGEISPRRQETATNRRSKSHKKRSIEPASPPNTVADINNNKKDDSKAGQKEKADDLDLFNDSDGLPGLSDEELAPLNNATKNLTNGKKIIDEFGDGIIPIKGASSALEKLLGGNKSPNWQKKPTMLDQIMSSKVKKPEPKVSKTKFNNVDYYDDEDDGDDDNDIFFGDYSPSMGDGRPATTPNKRSVHFANELVLDMGEESNCGRPSTEPVKNRSNPMSDFLDSSLDDSMNREVFQSTKKKIEEKGESQKIDNKNGKLKKQASKDDWLELGDDHTDELNLLSTGDMFSPRSKPPVQQQQKRPTTKPSPVVNATNNLNKNDEVASICNETKTNSPESLDLPWDSISTQKRQSLGRRQNGSLLTSTSLTTETAGNNKNKDNINNADNKSKSSPEKLSDDKRAEDDFLNLLKDKQQQRNSKKTAIGVKEKIMVQQQKQSSAPMQHSKQAQQLIMQTPQQLSPQLVIQPPQSQPQIQQPVLYPVQQPFQQVLHHQPKINNIPHQQFVPEPNQTSEMIQQIRDDLHKDISKEHQEDFNASKRQFHQNKAYLESELRELQEKWMQMSETKESTTTDSARKMRGLEVKVSELEVERDHLLVSIEALKQRQKEEIAILEASHKNRVGYMEVSYKRREQQLHDKMHTITSYFEDKERALLQEKDDIMTGHRKKYDSLERNQLKEIERLKELHKKSMDELLAEKEQQLAHMRMVKEQEVNAAASAFSHTKSLQTLMREVHNSTQQLSSLQKKIDSNHSNKLEEKELSLNSRNQYLKNIEEKLHAQEIANEEERHRLQNLVMKLEVQLREQTRQLEQDRRKISQDDDRLKAMQTALDAERRITSDQLANERNQLDKAREEMLNEQRRVIAECYEEKRKISEEKNQLNIIQRDLIDRSRKDRSTAIQAESELEATLTRYQHEASTIGVRLAQVKKDEDSLLHEKEDFMRQKQSLEQDMQQLKQVSRDVQERSEEVESFAEVATQIQEEAERMMSEAHAMRAEMMDANQELKTHNFSLQHQERILNEEREKLTRDKKNLEANRRANLCSMCRNNMFLQGGVNTSERYVTNFPAFNQQYTQQQTRIPNQTNLMSNSKPNQSTIVSSMGGIDLRSSTPTVATLNIPFIPTHKNKNNPHKNILDNNIDAYSDAAGVCLNATYCINNIPVEKGDGLYSEQKTEQDFSVDSLNMMPKPKLKNPSYVTKTPEVFTSSTADVFKNSSFPGKSTDVLEITVEEDANAENDQNGPVIPAKIPEVGEMKVSEGEKVLTSENPEPPDLIFDNFEFNRTIRRWNTAKARDDSFFEEEKRYLKSLQTKRNK